MVFAESTNEKKRGDLQDEKQDQIEMPANEKKNISQLLIRCYVHQLRCERSTHDKRKTVVIF